MKRVTGIFVGAMVLMFAWAFANDGDFFHLVTDSLYTKVARWQGRPHGVAASSEDFSGWEEDLHRGFRDGRSTRGGFITNGEIKLAYASWYDRTAHKLYYRFHNYGAEVFCANAKEFIAIAGDASLVFSPGEVKYFVVSDSFRFEHRTVVPRLRGRCEYFNRAHMGMHLLVPR